MRRLLAAASLAGCASLIGVGDLTLQDASVQDTSTPDTGAPACGWPGPDAGLLAYYPFDEDAGSYAHDCSGHDQLGYFVTAQTGWAPVDGHQGGAISIDSNGNGCVELPTTLVPEGATFSVSAWVTASAIPTNFATIIGRHYSNTDNKGWRIAMLSVDAGISVVDFHIFSLIDGGDYELIGPRMSINDGWHHVVVTYTQGDAATVAVDDASVTGASPLPILQENHAIRIGCRGDLPNAYPFVGRIDELRIYDHVLDAGEIAELAK